jgi:hypothetical protein
LSWGVEAAGASEVEDLTAGAKDGRDDFRVAAEAAEVADGGVADAAMNTSPARRSSSSRLMVTVMSARSPPEVGRIHVPIPQQSRAGVVHRQRYPNIYSKRHTAIECI